MAFFRIKVRINFCTSPIFVELYFAHSLAANFQLDHEINLCCVSHGKLFRKLALRGAPPYIVLLLCSWYKHQRPCVEWGANRSDFFYMTNGIRQGSIITPYLFNTCVNELNDRLSRSKFRCHIGGNPSNNFSYVDDLAILAPSARALNELLRVWDEFAKEKLIEYSPTKTVLLLVPPHHLNVEVRPIIYLGEVINAYYDKLKYLGQTITHDMKDDEDIDQERRKLAVRGNILIR